MTPRKCWRSRSHADACAHGVGAVRVAFDFRAVTGEWFLVEDTNVMVTELACEA
jgi:hypothetical protein